jgi:arginase family enzyme
VLAAAPVGLRGRAAPRCGFSHDSGMRVVYVDELQEKGVPAILDLIRKPIGDKRCYLSIDTDALDCSVIPGTALPEPFGLTGIEVRDMIGGVADRDIADADLMELSPPWDRTGMSSCLASGNAFELLCLVTQTKSRHASAANKTHWARELQ